MMNVENATNLTEGQGRLPSKGSLSIHQKALYLFWLSVISLAVFRKLLFFFKVPAIHTFRLIASDNENCQLGWAENGDVPQKAVQSKEHHAIVQENDVGAKSASQAPGSSRPSVDQFLYTVAVFGFIMFFYYLCDDEHYFPVTERTYSRDLFWFLVLLLFAVSVGMTRKETTDKILNREQTEEWKGWMQVMFVWYHYFKAAETYNAIRVFIAAYVWMTGFGKINKTYSHIVCPRWFLAISAVYACFAITVLVISRLKTGITVMAKQAVDITRKCNRYTRCNFSFFWVRRDFSLYRVLKMLFRLNFLVVITCLVVRNEYMLYYICPMHTFWFLSVYCFMKLLNTWNEDPKKMTVKFMIYFLLVFLMFDVPGVGNVVFKPLSFILSYENSLHEWMFRAGLDHYATLLGMLCAYFHPNFERLMRYLDEKSSAKRIAIRCGIASVCLTAFALWVRYIFALEKYEYNKLHPYFSFVPLLSYIFLRNVLPVFRKYYFYMFTWLGKVTLETYISQLHIYLQGNAKFLISFFPGYPLLNFAFASVLYLFLSYQLFHLTVDISSFLIPKDYNSLMKTLAIGIVWLTMCYFAGFSLTGLYFS